MENIDIKSSQKGQRVARNVIKAIRDNKKGENNNDYSELKDFINQNSYSKEFLENISKEDNYIPFSKSSKKDDIERLVSEIQTIELKKRKTRKIVAYSLSIAAALVVLSMIVYHDSGTKDMVLTENKEIEDRIVRPTLIATNGNKIELEKITEDKTTYIVKGNKAEGANTIQYQTIVVPSTYTFKVILSDSSEVILNANSKLKYPEFFTEERREVILEGEGYFKIKKSGKPFVVIAENCVIKVYGTNFNINAYNKNKIRTTLVCGLVGVSVKDNAKIAETMLIPNHMLEMNSGGESSIVEVDAGQYISWVNGEISCVNEPLLELLNKLSNWYGIEFVNSDKVKDIKMSTSFNNTMKLEKVLQSIMITAEIRIVKQNDGKYVIL